MAIARQQVKLNRSELLPKVGIKGSYDYVHGLELNNKNFLDDLLLYVDDSKKLTEKRREALYDQIMETAVSNSRSRIFVASYM